MSAVHEAARLPVRRRWPQRTLVGLLLLGFAAALLWGVMHMSHGPDGPKRQVARITLLPDTPPPPPPPPTPDKKPQPKETPTRQPQQQAPKQEAPPAPAALKMEGPAGDAPSGLVAGEVKQDYIGGDIGNGSRYSAYVARLEQLIQAELTRKKLRVNNVKLFVWLRPDGSVEKLTVAGGDGEAEKAVRVALAELSRVEEAPLADMPMPVGLQVSVR